MQAHQRNGKKCAVYLFGSARHLIVIRESAESAGLECVEARLRCGEMEINVNGESLAAIISSSLVECLPDVKSKGTKRVPERVYGKGVGETQRSQSTAQRLKKKLFLCDALGVLCV
jgi:hypothetical protein